MKKLKLTTGLFLALLTVSSCGNNAENAENTVNESFKVYGNCGMCEKTIEGALKDIDGIYSADWDRQTKMMAVSYDKTKHNQREIKEKISKVGYDTEDTKSTAETYDQLPACCHYDRPEK